MPWISTSGYERSLADLAEDSAPRRAQTPGPRPCASASRPASCTCVAMRPRRLPVDRVRLEPRLGDLPRRLDLPDGASCMVDAAFELPNRRPTRRRAWNGGSTKRRSAGDRRWWPPWWSSRCSGAASSSACRRWPASSPRACIPAWNVRWARRRWRRSIAWRSSRRHCLRPDERRWPRGLRPSPVWPAGDYVLEFRKSPAVGPNAFALPGGTVVLLDELVAAAAHDDEIAAVLAHEIGHLHGRHTMRHVLQTSVAGVRGGGGGRRRPVGVVVRRGLAGVPARSPLFTRASSRGRRLRSGAARPGRHRPRPLRALPHPHGGGTRRTACPDSSPRTRAQTNAAATPGADRPR